MSLLKLLLSLLMLMGIGAKTPTSAPTPVTVDIPVPAVSTPQTSTGPQDGASTTVDANDINVIAQCLTDKGVKFYGAYWCPHCADQKKRFGDAMQYITYIECDPRGENAQPDVCAENDITSYPTWIFPTGEKVVGATDPAVLARKADCL